MIQIFSDARYANDSEQSNNDKGRGGVQASSDEMETMWLLWTTTI
jgi:hypothetical protein